MLISAKLTIPPLVAKRLPRTHLVGRLSACRDRRLALITGPAGSGKTSLVCQWIAEDNLPAAWYAIDDADNDPDLFFRYLLTTLGRVDGRLRSAVAPWLEGQKRIDVRQFLPRFVGQLSDLSGDVYLVLENYHLIVTSEIHDSIAYLLHQPLPAVHVVIISRRAVPFSVAKIKLWNQTVEISSEDLKLTYRETKRFFQEILPIKLSAGQMQELTRHMDGWVGGLQLFGLSLKGKKTVDVLRSVLNRASEEAADYLIDEVFSIQPERMKRFLCATTLLTRFNTDLCSEATGMPDACEVFAEALKNNLFLVPLDSEGEWYRYHPLFSKAVRKRAFASGDETSSQVYRTAALWFARHGYLEDAFRHAFASGDFEFAADMLEDFLMVLYERYDIASFRRWIHKLPRDVFASRALLRLFDCRFKIESVQLADVSATLDGIERRQSEVFARYEGHKRRLCQDLLLVLKRILPDWCDPENAEIESLEATLRQVSPGSRTLSAFWTMVPFSYFYKGRMSLANDALQQASSDVFASGNRSAIMVWFRVSATVERFQGRLHRSEEVLNKAFRYFGRNGLSHPQPRFVLDSQMAWIHYMRNDIERAHEAALAVLRYLDQTRFLYEIADVNHLLSLISLARGEADRMGRCTQRMERAARDIGTPGLIAFTEAHAARLAIATGDLERARKWMKRRKVSITEPFSLRFVTECLADAELCSAEERHRDALMVLNNLRGRCLEENMMEAVFEIDLRLAASLYAINDRHSARMVMQGALFFSEPEGYLRPFVERASSISPVLMDLARTQGKGQSLRPGLHTYLNAVSRSCGITEADLEAFGEQSESLAGALTRREVEILELMAAGYRDKEIAEKAFISLHTAKTHIKHILEKLGATTRVQAIRRAEELKNRKNR